MSDDNLTSQSPSPRNLRVRGAIYGALGAFLGVIPVSILKTFAELMRLCVRLTPDASNGVVSLSTCGVLYDTTESTAPACSAYLAIVVLLGALAGYLVARVRIPSVGATPGSSSEAKPPTIFWWAFGAGLLFDLIFVFVYLYIGQ
jgi:ribose/xylose/arabinose/galactoside ABC-type transport system permease subunit